MITETQSYIFRWFSSSVVDILLSFGYKITKQKDHLMGSFHLIKKQFLPPASGAVDVISSNDNSNTEDNENKQLHNWDYFTIILSSSNFHDYSIDLAKGASLCAAKIQKNKDLLLFSQVVVPTKSMIIMFTLLFCRGRRTVILIKSTCRTCSTLIFRSLTN